MLQAGWLLESSSISTASPGGDSAQLQPGAAEAQDLSYSKSLPQGSFFSTANHSGEVDGIQLLHPSLQKGSFPATCCC